MRCGRGGCIFQRRDPVRQVVALQTRRYFLRLRCIVFRTVAEKAIHQVRVIPDLLFEIAAAVTFDECAGNVVKLRLRVQTQMHQVQKAR